MGQDHNSMEKDKREIVPVKKVLIVTPFFAPQNHASVFRAYKLAKYLPQYGYKPYVLTVDKNYMYWENQRLIQDLPPEVEICTAKYIEPTVRGLRMMLGGADRSFSSIQLQEKLQPQQSSIVQGTQKKRKRKPGLGRRLYQWMIENVSDLPDWYWLWAGAAKKKAVALVKEHDIDLVYTTCVPYSNLRIGRHVQEETGIPWCSDFRDPCGYGIKHASDRWHQKMIEQHLMKMTMENADHITGLAASYSSVFYDMYGMDDTRFTFIPTGADDAYITEAEKAEAPEGYGTVKTLLFIGEFQAYYNRYFFELLNEAIEQGSIDHQWRLLFVGHHEVNTQLVTQLVEGLEHIVPLLQFEQQMPQHEVYVHLQHADCCLLMAGQNRMWWNNFAKMVDFIAFKKLIVAQVPDPSEARSELQKSGLGIFLDGIDRDADITRLCEAFNTNVDNKAMPYSDRYRASRQAEDFSKVFNTMLEVHNA